MKAVIAIDSFKGSLSSMEAGNAAAEGIKQVYPDAAVFVRPLADGGEGTVEALTAGMGGRLEQVAVTGPLGHRVNAVYGVLEPAGDGKEKTAILEMSAAAGITLLEEADKNPLYTTTYGVGEMIRDAIQKGCRRFIVGIGGSATNDGGIGMLQALGYGLLDAGGRQVLPGARGLEELVSISTRNVIPELSACTFLVACDVTNPLCGRLGCSAVFGPQKGATPSMITQMDQWLLHYADLARRSHPHADPEREGAGAAGGLGFAFQTFTNAVLESGIKIVLEETRLEDFIREADLVVTGEGRLDAQTAMGKAPIGVAAIAKRYGKKVIAFSGCVTEDATICNENGIDAFFPILREVTSLEQAMCGENARRNMIATVAQVFRLLRCYECEE